MRLSKVFQISAFLLIAFSLHAHAQWTNLYYNGQNLIKPPVPMFQVQLYGVSPGQCVVADTNAFLTGGSCSSGSSYTLPPTNYSSTTTYVTGQTVFYGGFIFQSLQSGNLNQNPYTATTYWTTVGGGYTVASPGTYGLVQPDGTTISSQGGVLSAVGTSVNFSSLLAGTNTRSLLMGSGGSLSATGTGTITATSVVGGSSATSTTTVNPSSLYLSSGLYYHLGAGGGNPSGYGGAYAVLGAQVDSAGYFNPALDFNLYNPSASTQSRALFEIGVEGCYNNSSAFVACASPAIANATKHLYFWDYASSQTMMDFVSASQAQNFYWTSNFTPQFLATTSSNLSSPSTSWIAAFWNGTQSLTDTYSFQNVIGTGTSPSSQFQLGHSGTGALSNFSVKFFTPFTANTYSTSAVCSTTGSPAVCGSAPAGAVVVAAGASSVVVNTSVVTAISQIFLQDDPSLSSRLGVTCQTASIIPTVVSARVAGTSFTILPGATPSGNPLCLSYFIVN